MDDMYSNVNLSFFEGYSVIWVAIIIIISKYGIGTLIATS